MYIDAIIYINPLPAAFGINLDPWGGAIIARIIFSAKIFKLVLKSIHNFKTYKKFTHSNFHQILPNEKVAKALKKIKIVFGLKR